MPQETLCFSGEQYDVVGWFVDFFTALLEPIRRETLSQPCL